VNRKFLRFTHAVGSDAVRVVAGALAIISAALAIADMVDDTIGLPALAYVAALFLAFAVAIVTPVYRRIFVAADQEQKEEAAQQPISAREDEQRQTLRELQDLMPRFTAAARRIYEERRRLYLESRTTDIPESLRDSFRTVDELDQQILNLMSRVQNPKIRQAADILYLLGRRMAYFEPATWDSKDLYGGYTPSFIMVDRRNQLTGMIGKVLRGDSIDDVVVTEPVHEAGVRP
jgi:hypothetical protein